MERALSFGSVADDYDRYRPGYPEEVVDLVVGHAQGEVRRALEVGAGTGKATVAFAGRGLEVLAVEPDAGMREVLAERVQGLPVTVVPGAFEDVDPGTGPVDLVYAAAAFHWTDPATRWGRAAALLRPGGVLAVLGSRRDLADPELAAAVDRLAAEVVDFVPSAWHYSLDDARATGDWTDVVETVVPREVVMTADDFVAHLTTVSAYRVLADDVRSDVLARTRELLPDEVRVDESVNVHLLRRAAG